MGPGARPARPGGLAARLAVRLVGLGVWSAELEAWRMGPGVRPARPRGLAVRPVGPGVRPVGPAVRLVGSGVRLVGPAVLPVGLAVRLVRPGARLVGLAVLPAELAVPPVFPGWPRQPADAGQRPGLPAEVTSGWAASGRSGAVGRSTGLGAAAAGRPGPWPARRCCRCGRFRRPTARSGSAARTGPAGWWSVARGTATATESRVAEARLAEPMPSGRSGAAPPSAAGVPTAADPWPLRAGSGSTPRPAMVAWSRCRWRARAPARPARARTAAAGPWPGRARRRAPRRCRAARCAASRPVRDPRPLRWWQRRRASSAGR
jgi:hypothetical protein